jgi:hypothetical protein
VVDDGWQQINRFNTQQPSVVSKVEPVFCFKYFE